MTVKIKGIVDEAEEFHGDMQEIDPETHMLNTVRTALQDYSLMEHRRVAEKKSFHKKK